MNQLRGVSWLVVTAGMKIDPKKVFIIDDNRFFLESLVFLLNRQNDIRVVGTHHRIHGVLQMIEETKPDVIILDMRLPDGDGISLLQQIKLKCDIPVIMLTMYEEYKDRAMKNGAFGYLVKGEGLERLYQMIRKASEAVVHS